MSPPEWPRPHLDLHAELHLFFDCLVTGKTVLDVGAGLGKSKARMRHHAVTTFDPSPQVAGMVDVCQPTMPGGRWQVVTAFEVLEHVDDAAGFLRDCGARATEAVFLTTPNAARYAGETPRARSRGYEHGELLDLCRGVWPGAGLFLFASYKDGEGGWVEMPGNWRDHDGLKHLVLVNLALPRADRRRILWIFRGRRP